MLNEAQVAALLGVPTETVVAWRGLRVGPPSVKAAGRVYFFHDDVAWWRADHPTTGGPDTISSPPSSAIAQVSIGKSRAVSSAA